MPVLWMLGHSDRSFAEFVQLVESQRIVHVVDIRTYPASRRHPQFDRLELERRLPERGVQYTWMPALGGMREPLADSRVNAAWKEDGLRAYADYMQSTAFEEAWQRLANLAHSRSTAAMCAEARPLQCHRQILADAFVARRWTVQHLVSVDDCLAHTLTPTALVDESQRVTYPGVPQLPF